jgi:hypothetical protein
MMEEAQAQSNSTNEDKEIDALQDAQAQEPEQQDNPQQLPAVSVADAELEAQNYKFGSKAEERLDPEMLVPAKEPEAKKEERGPNVFNPTRPIWYNEDGSSPREPGGQSNAKDVPPGVWTGAMNCFLRTNLAHAKRIIKKDWDMCFIVDGYEGCQPAGSKVLMYDGKLKNIEDVVVGDIVLSPQRSCHKRPAVVLNTVCWWSKENYKVVAVRHKRKTIYRCSSNHVIPVKVGCFTKQYRADEIAKMQKKNKKNIKGFFYKGKYANRNQHHILIDVELDEPGMVYGFTLSSRSGWYVTDNFAVTHNSGKSVLAQQCAAFLDDTFNIDRIAFTPDEFTTAVIKAQKYQAVIYDEAYGGMGSRAAMTEVNRTLMAVLSEIRQKNLFVFIVLPCYFELDKYAAVWRSRALLHVYTKNFDRGYFSFYNQEKKKLLYTLGKQFYSYYRPAPDFYGNFPNGYAVDEELYRKKKYDALVKRERKDPEKEDVENQRAIKWKNRAGLLLMAMREVTSWKVHDLALLVGMPDNELSKLVHETSILCNGNVFRFPVPPVKPKAPLNLAI